MIGNPRKAFSVSEAKQKLERYCVYQDRCHSEVRQKLESLRMIPEAIDLIMVHLIENDFLNEERFARSFARGKFNQKYWGKKRIVLELKRREVSPYNIKKGLEEIDDHNYQSLFVTIANKKWESLRADSPSARKRKFINYLLYRGWEPELVYDQLRELTKRK